MSQKELAKRANLSVSALSKIERGRYNDNVSVSLLFDIADGLQIDITMLVTFSYLEKIYGGNLLIMIRRFLLVANVFLSLARRQINFIIDL